MTQIQLSDPQAIILSTASGREDRAVFPVTASLKGGAVGNVCKSLLKKGLLEEIAATDLNTVWRHDEKHGPITLRSTSLACSALGITNEPNDSGPTDRACEPVQRRNATKQAKLIEMLRADGGATIDEIVAALEWQPHTCRGAMSGALKKKLGLTITSEKEDQRGRVYRIENTNL